MDYSSAMPIMPSYEESECGLKENNVAVASLAAILTSDTFIGRHNILYLVTPLNLSFVFTFLLTRVSR